MKERPILFQTSMVKKIDSGIKTETRRIIKPQPDSSGYDKFEDYVLETVQGFSGNLENLKRDVTFSHKVNNLRERNETVSCPHGKPGDMLWIKETFTANYFDDGSPGYRALFCEKSREVCPEPKWTSSLFMPKKLARLFLVVKEVKVERLQEINEKDIKAEGVESGLKKDWIELWNSINASPKPVKRDGEIIYYVSYPWEDVRETREYKGKPWHVFGNPFVWVVKFHKDESLEIYSPKKAIGIAVKLFLLVIIILTSLQFCLKSYYGL